MRKHRLAILILMMIFFSPHWAFAHGEVKDGHDIKGSIEKFRGEGTTTEENNDQSEDGARSDEEHQTEEGTHSDEAHQSEEGTHSDVNHKDEEATHSEEAHQNKEVTPTQTSEEQHGPEDNDSEEKSPNYMIIGIFGAIILSFILFGTWRKWFRKTKG